MKREIPILFKQKEDCCGCTACAALCPRDAIQMAADEEGFLYPKIKEEMCVACWQCMNVCPVKQLSRSTKNKNFMSN